VEHQLDAHEHDDGIAADEDADSTDREERGGQDQVVGRIHVSCSPSGNTGSSRTPGVEARMDSGAAVPSGSSAGVPIASPEDSTPGPGSGWGRPDRILARATAFWVRFGSS